LAHDALIFFDFLLAHGEVLNEYAARPGQIGFRSQNRAANSGLAAGGGDAKQQSTH
jgi:hypothetical protein